MSDNYVENPSENITTTTRFQQTKAKVTEFVKKHKTAISVGAGTTALLGLAAIVRSVSQDDDGIETDGEFGIGLTDEEFLQLIEDHNKAIDAAESDESSDVIETTEDTVTESTE